MDELKRLIDRLRRDPRCDQRLIKKIEEEGSVPPFSAEARLLTYFLELQILSYNDYDKLVDDYYSESNSKNRYLSLYELAPRTFGQTWGEEHVRSLSPAFVKATKENVLPLYPSFDGEFDVLVGRTRVEVKACRANKQRGGSSLSSRAYSHAEAKAAGFKYHFQQVKVSCCDVFIWIGVCRDDLIYWVLTSDEVLNTGKLGTQHRNRDTGHETSTVFEGQVFMTEEELEPFRVNEEDLLSAVCQKGIH
jgi:hypothetical protein